MFIERKKKVKVVLGSLPLLSNIGNIFDDKIIDFFNEISKSIISNKVFRKYPDLVQFGFWSRKSNLEKISKNYKSNNLIIGRGIVLHIVPSNVPLNFAYSFAFGMLSGNANIIRLPSKNFTQTNLLCKIIRSLLNKNKFKNLKKLICLIKFERSDELASYFSKNVDCRLIWGGDETARVFKNYKTKLRCIDLIFPDRYSACLVDLKALEKLKLAELKILVKRFYNDCYTMDQQGCSSPQSIIWLGEKNLSLKTKFWSILKDIVEKEYQHDLPVTNKKLASIFKLAANNKGNFFYNLKNFKVAKINLNKNKKLMEKIKCHYGTFAEINIKKINELANIISDKVQTITYYGINKKNLENLIIKHNLKGVDRLVPIGRAFDMGEIWDGYDIIKSLSRTIAN